MWLRLLYLWTVLSLNLTFTFGSNLRTLKTFKVLGCNGDDLKLECPNNTVLSLYYAGYGRNKVEACAATGVEPHCTAVDDVMTKLNEICKEQRTCNLTVSQEAFGVSPCPREESSYLEVTYKCRPNTFYHKIRCEGEKMKIRCHKSLRIVIFDGVYGASQVGQYECPKSSSETECQAPSTTDHLVEECQGKLKCAVIVDKDTFGETGCDASVKPFLKVIYTCVPEDILQSLDLSPVEENSGISEPHYIGVTEEEEEELTYIATEHRTSTPSYASEEIREGIDANCTQPTEQEAQVIGFLTEWISAYYFIKGNKERFFLYLTLSLTTGLVVFLVILSARLYCQRHGRKTHTKLYISEPYSSEHYDPGERVDTSVEGVRYTPTRSTLRRNDSDSNPRAHNNNYYYS